KASEVRTLPAPGLSAGSPLHEGPHAAGSFCCHRGIASMNVLSALLPLLAGCCLVLSLVAIRRRLRSRPRKRRRVGVVSHPGARALLREQGLLQPEHFLDRGTFIVSGHPDRNVALVTLGTGPDPWICYLKRERRVSWLVRLMNFLAGFGLVSRSLR